MGGEQSILLSLDILHQHPSMLREPRAGEQAPDKPAEITIVVDIGRSTNVRFQAHSAIMRTAFGGEAVMSAGRPRWRTWGFSSIG